MPDELPLSQARSARRGQGSGAGVVFRARFLHRWIPFAQRACRGTQTDCGRECGGAGGIGWLNLLLYEVAFAFERSDVFVPGPEISPDVVPEPGLVAGKNQKTLRIPLNVHQGIEVVIPKDLPAVAVSPALVGAVEVVDSVILDYANVAVQFRRALLPAPDGGEVALAAFPQLNRIVRLTRESEGHVGIRRSQNAVIEESARGVESICGEGPTAAWSTGIVRPGCGARCGCAVGAYGAESQGWRRRFGAGLPACSGPVVHVRVREAGKQPHRYMLRSQSREAGEHLNPRIVLQLVNRFQCPIGPGEVEIRVDLGAVFPADWKALREQVGDVLLQPQFAVRSKLQVQRIIR